MAQEFVLVNVDAPIQDLCIGKRRKRKRALNIEPGGDIQRMYMMAGNQYFKVNSQPLSQTTTLRKVLPEVHLSMKINAIDKCTQ